MSSMNQASLSYHHQRPEVPRRGSSQTNSGQVVRLDELGFEPRKAIGRPVNQRSK